MRGWLKYVAQENIKLILVTLLVSQLLIGWLKLVAQSNIIFIYLTFEVSHLSKGWLNAFVDKYNYRASQYNHETDEYIKPKLSDRVKNIWNNKIQRDLYSAYLLLNHSEDLKAIDREKCIENFNTFLENHNQLISELKENWLTYPQSFWLENF